MAIHLLKICCPEKHCLMVAAYDPKQHGRGTAKAVLLDRMRDLQRPPWCTVCGATPLEFVGSSTKFASLAQAKPFLVIADKLSRQQKVCQTRN